MMYDMVVFIKSGGLFARADNLLDAFFSIGRKVGAGVKIGFYFVLQSDIYKFAFPFLERYKDSVLDVIIDDGNSWSKHYNTFFDKYKDKTKWFLISHDDVLMLTDNWFDIALKSIGASESEIGWVNFRNTYHYMVENRPKSVSCFAGMSLDRGKGLCTFECHNYTWHKYVDHVSENLHMLDIPKFGRPVKVHGMASQVNLISNESMKKVGYSEDWGPYTLMVDHDWTLEALKRNLWTIWLPEITFHHPNRAGNPDITRTRFPENPSRQFYKKWGFTHTYPEEEVEMIRKKYDGTLIPWSSYRNTYDWDYL